MARGWASGESIVDKAGGVEGAKFDIPREVDKCQWMKWGGWVVGLRQCGESRPIVFRANLTGVTSTRRVPLRVAHSLIERPLSETSRLQVCKQVNDRHNGTSVLLLLLLSCYRSARHGDLLLSFGQAIVIF
jgi:hypothetical protein